MLKHSSRSLATQGEKLRWDGSLSFPNIEGRTFNSRGSYRVPGQTRAFSQVIKEAHSLKEHVFLHFSFTRVLHVTTLSLKEYCWTVKVKVTVKVLIRGFKSSNWTVMAISELLAQSCGPLGCWVIHLSSTYGQNAAARKARPVPLQCQQRSCSVTYIHLAEVEWHSWTSHAASDQMSTLVAVFLLAARGAWGRPPAGQMGRQCVVVHCIVGSEECLQRSFLNQTGDQMSRRQKLSGVHQGKELLPEHTSSHFKSFPVDTQVWFGFFFFLFFFIPKATPHLN